VQNQKDCPVVGIVIPCFNESEVILHTLEVIFESFKWMKKNKVISEESFIACVDDGSTDNTWELILQAKVKYGFLKGIKLSRNFGHQNALLAGLSNFRGHADCLISIDADLQDDIGVMPEMLRRYKEGAQIVYGVRQKRRADNFLKKITALGFYLFIKMMGVKLIFNHADYRLASRRVLEELAGYREVNLFLRGIFTTLGFPAAYVYYDRQKRKKGRTKYSFKKMFSFAWEGVTSFSIVPLRLIALLGLIIFLGSLFLEAYAIYSYLKLKSISGWASIVIPMYFIGGIQLFSIGIIGEYLGKIYQELKQRPRFIIEDTFN